MNTTGSQSGKATENTGTTTNGRKAYKSPTLQLFGRLSHITHGSGKGKSDADGKTADKD
ncbi:MAG: hypothetical protein HOB98_05270 [Gammaproteobacteria bacterium]|jgi:hypothetical protein|nr:hypothetical protein [Gammaproteobacteria bacterium]MBT3868284.1 hypothetical protein [Gammaproteobacteria bacterium]MBT4381097.1 hypothetical protein [Gammaproteobacteria bacterium]MBT4615843.1 hypothetical protein [Gammaproteobacteria bacterium]MBT5196565.1 hypothetical protein [Gammaproteobacteria bacterium]